MDIGNNIGVGSSQDANRRYVGSASFAITARIAMQLGRESISSSVVAIIELVKNAYDADAENVYLQFFNLDSPEAMLVIDDDGNGMAAQQLVESWLVIGTDNKVITPRSKQKSRILTGEKGLGRLGLDRLCETTLIQSFAKEEEYGVEVEIDWRRYEHTNAKLESIEHNLYQIPKAETKSNGTRLILHHLKDNWSSEDLQKLYTELALLISPFGGINDFAISFFADSIQHLNGKIVSEDLLNAAEWKVISKLEISEKTAFVSHIMSSPLREAKFEFNRASWFKVFPDQHGHFPECGPVNFEFYFIPREDIPALSLKKAQIDKFLEANQGIRIYRDGFRVMPYGKPSGEGDWLSLGLRRTRSPGSARASSIGGWKLGYNQVVGAVFIEREKNNALLDQTNREGIVEGPAFYDLRRFALHAVEFFERQRQTYEKAQGPKVDEDDFAKARTEAEVSTQASIEAVDQLKTTVDNAVILLTQAVETNPASTQAHVDISNKLSEIVNEIDKRVAVQQSRQEELIQAIDKREEEIEEEFQRQKDTLSNLASLGILATTFGHETEAASNLMIANSNELKHAVKELFWVPPDTLETITRTVEDIEHGSKKINTFATFTLRNVNRDKRQRTKIYLNNVIKRVFDSFAVSLEQEWNIKVSLDFSQNIPAINAFIIDWESIIINFITNAVIALENTPQTERQIRVRLRENQSRLRISFADSGYGIAAGAKDSIFLPTFSTKRNRNGDVIGTGMGLAIVQNFVDAYSGTIQVESPCDLGGAEFHIEVATSK